MEPLAFQVTVDATDPHAQARFWAEALGWRLELDTEFIRGIIEQGHASDDDVVEIDGELFWKIGAGIEHPGGRGDPVDGSGGSRRILFVAVPEAKQVKNRVHLDVNVGPERRTEQEARLVALGATKLYEVSEPGANHITMTDPEGNEFCLQ